MSARSFDIKRIGVKQSNVRVMQSKEGIDVVLHSTSVVRVRNGIVMLFTGNWRTVTTRTCINRALEQLGINARVVQRARQWYLVNGEDDARFFEEGMRA